MFLLMLIVSIMITLSQILVVHHHSHEDPKQRDLSKFRNVLMELERNINLMLKRDVLPFKKYVNAFQAVIFSKRIATVVERLRPNTYMSEKLVINSDEMVTPSTDRKSRFLQNLDMGNHSKENKMQSNGAIKRHVKRRIKEKETIKLFPTRISGNTQVTNNIISDVHNDVEEIHDEAVSKSRRLKGNSWLTYKQTLSPVPSKTRHKCSLIPVGLGK